MSEHYTVGPIPRTHSELERENAMLRAENRLLREHALSAGAYLKQLGDSMERMGPNG